MPLYDLVEIRFMKTFYIDYRLMVKVVCFSHLNCEEGGVSYVYQSRMSYFGYVAEDRTKWDKGR